MTPGLPSSEARVRVASGQPQPPLVTVLSLQTSGASEARLAVEQHFARVAVEQHFPTD